MPCDKWRLLRPDRSLQNPGMRSNVQWCYLSNGRYVVRPALTLTGVTTLRGNACRNGSECNGFRLRTMTIGRAVRQKRGSAQIASFPVMLSGIWQYSEECRGKSGLGNETNPSIDTEELVHKAHLAGRDK